MWDLIPVIVVVVIIIPIIVWNGFQPTDRFLDRLNNRICVLSKKIDQLATIKDISVKKRKLIACLFELSEALFNVMPMVYQVVEDSGQRMTKEQHTLLIRCANHAGSLLDVCIDLSTSFGSEDGDEITVRINIIRGSIHGILESVRRMESSARLYGSQVQESLEVSHV